MGLQINLMFDANAEAAPQSFRDAVQTAANELDAAIDDPITVNVEVGYGEYDLGGPQYTPLTSNYSLGGINTEVQVSYPLLIAALAANETTAADTEAISSLPVALTLNGDSNFFISTAEAKALGVIPAASSAIDGFVGFPTSFTSEGVTETAIAELAHALGLLNGGGVETLVEYTGPGNHLLTAGTTSTPAYFSIDDGNTDLANFNVTFDSTLFENLNDPLNAPSPGGALTSLDLNMLSILGFDVTSTPTLPTPSITPVPMASNVPATVMVQNVSVAENAAIPVSSLIKSVSAPSGDSIAYYGFYDQGGGTGHFAVDGLTEPDSQWIYVLDTELGTLKYVGGSATGSDLLDVCGFDCTADAFTAVAQLTATTAPANGVTIVVNQSGQTILASNSTIDIATGKSTTVYGSNNQFGLNNNDTLQVTGNNNTIGAGSGGSITLQGSGDQVTLGGVGTTIVDYAGNSQVTGSQNTIDMASGIGLTVFGNSDQFGLNNNDTLQITGTNNSIGTGSGGAITILGSGDQVTLGGTGTTVVDYASNSQVSGSQNTVDMANDVSLTVYGNNNQFGLNNNDTLQVTGNGNVVGAGNGGSIALWGAGDQVILGGAGTTVVDYASNTQVTGSQGIIDANGNVSLTVFGNSNQFGLNSNDTLQLSGNNNTIGTASGGSVTLWGSGNQVIFGGIGTTVVDYASNTQFTGAQNTINVGSNVVGLTVLGNSDQLGLNSNDTLQITGTNNSIGTGSGGAITILGSGDQMTLGGTGTTVVDYASNSQVTGSQGTIDVASGVNLTVSGNNDQFGLNNNDTLQITGIDNVAFGGTGNQITLSGTGTVNMGGNANTAAGGVGGGLIIDMSGSSQTFSDVTGVYNDTVVGFGQAAGDKIHLTTDTVSDALAHMQLVNGSADTLITLSDSSTILLKGVTNVSSSFFA